MAFVTRSARRTGNALGLLSAVLFAAGCAATPGRTRPVDSWEGMNRSVYKFNDFVDRAALKPAATGYQKVTPRWFRVGVSNFLANLEYPAVALNQFLQGKGGLGVRDTGRFLINSTFGLGGLLDLATPIGLEANDEDFGQTLATWGVGSGPYVMLPIFGPSTVRDAPARVFEFFVDPLSYTDVAWELRWGKRGLDGVSRRAELLSVDQTLERAYDPYVFVRDAWVQKREYEVFDGAPPEEPLDEEWPEDEDAGNDEPAKQSPQPATTEPAIRR